MNIAQQLVQGSHNIDRMKSEVREVVSILIGMLKMTPVMTILELDEMHEFEKTKWTVRGRVSSVLNKKIFDVKDEVLIECFLKTSNGGLEFVFSNSRTTSSGFPTDTTQDVYESLPEFVETMYKRYGLQKKVSVLVKAAEVFKS